MPDATGVSVARRSGSTPPRLHGPAALLLFVLACLAFGGFVTDLLLHGPLTAADAAISAWFQRHPHPVLTTVLWGVTELHSTKSVLIAVAVAALALVWRREPGWVLLLVVCVPGGMWLNSFVKGMFQRHRPILDQPLVTIASYSFPSGHTAAATVAWGFMLLWLFAHRAGRRERLLGSVAATLMVLLTALSRVYLGAHYPTDVAAAVAEGLAWLALCCVVAAPFGWRRT